MQFYLEIQPNQRHTLQPMQLMNIIQNKVTKRASIIPLCLSFDMNPGVETHTGSHSYYSLIDRQSVSSGIE